MRKTEIAAIVMASGFSRRMGQNKLLLLLDGRPMYTYVLDMLENSCLEKICVVTAFDEIADDAIARGMQTVRNHEPERGQSHSVVLGVQSMTDCAGWMFFSADQPFLKSSTVDAMTAAAAEKNCSILAARCRGRRGQPVYFSREFRDGLLHLTGDAGGRSLLRKYPEKVCYFDIEDERQMRDLDTPEDLLSC